ncbi:hypothetical protein HMPREF3193_00852 [Bifidobacterium breve]|nr:hypothetical protein HMPREF1587_00356 [Bifidobacterium breve JCP7499]KWZ85688.1 hypothetical protein HMPREF3193_00852 [Bifidobacterium breve]
MRSSSGTLLASRSPNMTAPLPIPRTIELMMFLPVSYNFVMRRSTAAILQLQCDG